MITVGLMGGLGNQMFQYAYGWALMQRGREVRFNPQRLGIGKPEGPHNREKPDYGLDGFDCNVIFGDERPKTWEGPVGYEPKALDVTEGAVTGYFQSEKYFLDAGKDAPLGHPLVHRFFPRMKPTEEIKRLAMSIHGDDSVAVQVRRGDYTLPKIVDFHGVMPKEYFIEGVAMTRGKRAFIFTDDIEWCQEKFPAATIVSTGSRHWDIQLMAGAHSIVISNSSFGWWGAWLGDFNFWKPGRTVIAPKAWFKADVSGADDIVPTRWTKI